LLSAEKLQRLAASGVKNYHCNLETAPSHFSNLCTTHTTQEKIDTLRAARAAGLKLCSGGIIGMGETGAQRVELAITLQQLGVDSIPLNLLNPIPGTPLENTPPLGDDEILITIAIFRFTNPRAWIRFAGGRTGMLHLQGRAMHAGINGALVGDLLTTVGVGMDDDISLIRSLGFDC
jgi:biotin synthase